MYKKILATLDGSEYSRLALKQAAEIAQSSGAHLTSIHVLDLPPQLKSLKSYNLIKDQLMEEGRKIISEAAEILAPYNISHEEKISSGSPGEEIIKEANEGGYELVAIGSRGLGEVKGWLMGSVSRKVTQHVKSTVLVVK